MKALTSLSVEEVSNLLLNLEMGKHAEDFRRLGVDGPILDGVRTAHPTPYTLHPAPYTLHPAPHTLHPKPYTLNPKPEAYPSLSTHPLNPRRRTPGVSVAL